MKKSIALILAVLMTLSLAACGGGGGSSDKGGALPGIDMKSTDTQTWYAAEDEACCLSLFFGDNGKLIAAGAYNLSL